MALTLANLSRKVTSDSDSTMGSITLEDIKRALREETDNNIKPKLNEIQSSIQQLSQRVLKIENTVSDMENSLDYNDKRIDDIINKQIPDLKRQVTEVTSDSIIKQIEGQTHKRKWGLTINGINGKAGENDTTTRRAIIKFATEILKVPQPYTPDFYRLAACHRLKQTENAPIIVLFTDLSERNAWIDCGKNLAGLNGNTDRKQHISIAPDLPPAIRPLRDNILKQRQEIKRSGKKTTVKYLAEWPFVILKVEGQRLPVIPQITKKEVIESFLRQRNPKGATAS